MLWALIKLIILGFFVAGGVAIYEDFEKDERQTSQKDSRFESQSAARPDPKKYKIHPNPVIGGGDGINVNHNFSCNDLSRLNQRMRDAYDDYQYSGKSWDREKYVKAKRDLDALRKQCY